MLVKHVEVNPTQLKTIDCIYDGRFQISEEAFYDSQEDIVYAFPADQTLDNIFLEDIEGLPAGRISALLLYALAWRPIPYIKDEDLLDHTKGLRIVASSAGAVRVGRFVWKFETPIPHAFHSTFYHVPGISNILVNEAGGMKTTSNVDITLSANHGYNVMVSDDLDNLFEVHASVLVASAFNGIYMPDAELIRYIDGDETNFARSNVAYGTAYLPEKVDARNDTDPIYLVQ
ncbi:hypothetical protein SM033_00289 [Vibrio phage vB_VpaM_sm033]|nr:hypothetical protein SM033_00289 [Vibrio phage vB_VpaM_sm033]